MIKSWEGGGVSWNTRGLFVTRSTDKERKLQQLDSLLDEYNWVGVQEPHLTPGNWGALGTWISQQPRNITAWGGPTDDIEEGVLL